MNKFTKEMIDSYADKLLIGLSNDENKMIQNEFDYLEKSMEEIANIKNIEMVEGMFYALDDFSYKLTSDLPLESVTTDCLLKNCDSVEDNLVSVPKVVG